MPASSSFINYPGNSQAFLATAIMAQLETALINAGWTFVEELIVGANTVRIIRTGLGAALPANGGRIAVALERPTSGNGLIGVRAGEAWDSVTDRMLYPLADTVATSIGTLQASDWAGTGSAAGIALGTTTGGPTLGVVSVPSTNNYDVFCYADKSWMSLQILNGGTSTLVAGTLVSLMEPFYTESPATFPPLLGLDTVMQTVPFRSRCVRGIPGTTIANWAPLILQLESQPLGGLSSTGVLPDALQGKIRPGRVLASGAYASVAGRATIQPIVGVLPGVVILESTAGSDPRPGDTFTLDGVIYMKIAKCTNVGAAGGSPGVYIPAGHSW